MKKQTKVSALPDQKRDYDQKLSIVENEAFFLYFLWVFIKLKSYKSVKIVLNRKFKDTSNHQNFMSMESKDTWDMTGGSVLRKLKKNLFLIYLLYVLSHFLYILSF